MEMVYVCRKELTVNTKNKTLKNLGKLKRAGGRSRVLGKTKPSLPGIEKLGKAEA